jgi:hypothetical protein
MITRAKKTRIPLSPLLPTPVKYRTIIRASHKGWNPRIRRMVAFPAGRNRAMKNLFILGLALGLYVSTGACARAIGLSMHHASSSGGAFGSSAAAPGTNSLGTALPSSGGRGRGHKMKGPPLGTGNPAVDREDAKADKMVRSICRGC